MRHRKRKDGRGGTKRREFEECRAESRSRKFRAVRIRSESERIIVDRREIRNPSVCLSVRRVPFHQFRGGEIDKGCACVCTYTRSLSVEKVCPPLLPSPVFDLPLAHANSVAANTLTENRVRVRVRTSAGRHVPVWHTRRPNDVTVMVHLRDACHRTGCLFRIN